MTLEVLTTGSKGNCYVLTGQGGKSSLLLDAGLSIKKLSPMVDLSKVAACLLTHEHGDHSQAFKELLTRGIKGVCSKGTAKNLRLKSPFLGLMADKDIINIDGWQIMAFDTEHDADEPLGFLIRDLSTGETVVYATDTYYIKYRFPDVNYWIIECNYIERLLNEQITNDELEQPLRVRLAQSHMSLERLIELFKANDLSNTRAVVAVHLSDKRSDEAIIKRELSKVLGKDIAVYTADDGDMINLELTPF